ncbi:MAG: hypothetical protein KKH44_01325 [Bacteroidetes bacterium]|nr:hypothetical protein [Bacteroidota bacterium]
MIKNRIKVESKDSDGNPKTVYVIRPTKDNNAQAQIVASKSFRDSILNGALVRKALEDLLIKQGIWDAERQTRVDKIDDEIREKLLKLKKGGIKLTEARDLAIEVRIGRMNRANLVSEKNAHDEFTAEAQSENAKFDYLVSVCVKDEDGSNIFKDVDDYKDKALEPYASDAAAKLATLVWGLEDNWESNLPENKFLEKFSFVDKDLRLVNKDGKYVTKDGKLIDNDFRYINDAGEYVDIDGNRIDKDGLPVVDFVPFLDDNGNPINEAVEETQDVVVEEKPTT